MIEIKSFDGSTVEEVEFSGTIGSYLDGVGVNWRNIVVQPIQVIVNDKDVFHHDWDNTLIGYEDKVEIIVIPEGGVIKGITKIFGSVLNLAFGFLLPSGSKGRSAQRHNTPQGERLEASEIKANTIKFGSTVPEVFGRHRRYFDYLNEPRSYYKDERKQVSTAVLCVGNGYYDSEPFQIGDTPFSNTENTTGRMFQPNEYLEGYIENWHTVPEIGATSSGTAGLELSMEIISGEDTEDTHPEGGYIFEDNVITRADGSSYSADLSVGDKVFINFPLTYNHDTRPPAGYVRVATIVDGYFDHALVDGRITGSLIPGGVGDGPYGEWMQRQDVSGGYYWLIKRGVYESLTPLILTPNNGEAIEAWGDTKQWTITEINGGSITVDDGQGGKFPNMTNENATLVFELSPTITRGRLTDKYKATPKGVKTKFIEVDFYFPQGLCYINDNGGLSFESASIEVTVIDANDQAFGVVHRFDYRRNTNDQIGFTAEIELPYEFEPIVYMRRVGSINNSVQSHSQVVWQALKSRLPDIERYPDWTVVGVTMETGGKIAAQSENRINAIVTRKLSVMDSDGNWSSDLQPTRDIPPVIKYIAEQIGYTVNDLDMTEILRLYNLYWKPRGEYFDYICDQTTVRNALEMCLSAGMSDLTISNGLLKPYRDEIMTEPEQAYSSQNTQGIDYHFVLADENQDFDGVEIEYTDPVTFDRKIIVCSTKPEQKRIKLQKVSLNGVTSELRAWIIGMRLWLEMLYIRKQFVFKTEMDGFNSEYGSFISVTNDSASYQQSALILGINGKKITISEKVRAGMDVFSYRLPNGKPSKSYDITHADENNIWVNEDIAININLNKELPQALLGVGSKHVTYCIVDDITPNGLENATIKASNYDERIFEFDDYTEVIK